MLLNMYRLRSTVNGDLQRWLQFNNFADIKCLLCDFIRDMLNSSVDPGWSEGAIAPPNKIYLGESIFSPPQSFSLCISYTPGKTLRGRKDTQNESRGDGDSETVDERDM